MRYIKHKVNLVCPSGLAEGPAYYARKTVHAVRTVKTLRTDAVQIPGFFSHSPSIHRQLWNIVISLSLTYQQDVMEWSYVPAYLDSLCFLEWRVSWPAQTEQKHEDMALLTKKKTLRLADVTRAIQMLKWEQYCVHTLVKLPFFAASSKAASPTEMIRKKN